MQQLPDDLDLAPYEERLRQCLGNAAIAIQGFYRQDVTELVNEIKRLRAERDALLPKPVPGAEVAAEQECHSAEETGKALDTLQQAMPGEARHTRKRREMPQSDSLVSLRSSGEEAPSGHAMPAAGKRPLGKDIQ